MKRYRSCYEMILARRSIRRFKQKRIPYQKLRKMVKAAHLAPSAANLQPVEFIIVDRKEIAEELFPLLCWAAYLGKEGAPPEGMRPVAYIVVLLNKDIAAGLSQADAAAAVENILLVATEEGIGTCWLGSIDREAIASLLNIPHNFVVEYVVALGYPNEVSVVEKMQRDVRYWRDSHNRMHVPKRRLEDLLHRNTYRRKR